MEVCRMLSARSCYTTQTIGFCQAPGSRTGIPSSNSNRARGMARIKRCRASVENSEDEELKKIVGPQKTNLSLLSITASLLANSFVVSSTAGALEENAVGVVPAMSGEHWSSALTFELLNRVGVPLADLDPATAQLAITVLSPFFAFFNLLFIFRIVMSWYPQIPVSKFPFVLAYAPTEPILGPTRRLIPPVGGVDVAPVIWVALMSFLNEILLGKQGLFILLSQQKL